MTIVRQIEADDCCCNTGPAKKGLIPVAEATALVWGAGNAIGRVELVTPDGAAGRVLAEPVFAAAAVPPFDNSAMDGYAVRVSDFIGDGPWSFPVVGSAAAGHAAGAVLASGSVMHILTGAPVPNGADAIVPQESVSRSGDHALFTKRPLRESHVRYRGEDLDPGQLVVAAGCRLGAVDVAALAASGRERLPVRAPVRVAVLATGDELRLSGDTLDGAAIWDLNTPMLRGALRAAGAELVEAAAVVDDRAAMAAELTRLAATCDLIVTTGGISVGEKDFVKPALSDIGGRVVFSGVAMKPGKPVSFGKIGRTRWLGLPGNPYAAVVGWTLYGRPLLEALAGIAEPPEQGLPAVTTTRLSHPVGRTEFRLAKATGFDGQGRMTVRCAEATHSARVSGLAEADGFVEIPQEVEDVPANTVVRYYPF